MMRKALLAPIRFSSGPDRPNLFSAPSGPGLTSRSSTDTSSFSTASMAAGPQSSNLRRYCATNSMAHRQRRRATSGVLRKRAPSPTQSQSPHVATPSPPLADQGSPASSSPRNRRTGGVGKASAQLGPTVNPAAPGLRTVPLLPSRSSFWVPFLWRTGHGSHNFRDQSNPTHPSLHPKKSYRSPPRDLGHWTF